MVLNIEQDYLRFRQIVRGKIKQDLKKYISQGELIGKKGKDFVSIPIPQIEMPSFRFGRRNTGGVGQGEGEPGTALSPGDVDEDGNGTLRQQRLYQLIRQQGPIVDRTFEIEFLTTGAEAYVFTFG